MLTNELARCVSNSNNTSTVINSTSSTTTSTSSTTTSAGITTSTPHCGPIRLNSIKGYANRNNNVIYCPPLIRTTGKDDATAVVYFGGDVQDLPENMESNRDTKSYLKYNLENTSILLRESFPKSHILVIRPARMEYTTFSCFDNFVRGNNAGIPDHTPMHFALQHLEELLINVTRKLTKLMSESELISKMTVNTAENNIDNNQDMEIDILQVHDTVAINNTDDETIAFPCKTTNTTTESSIVTPCNSLPTIQIENVFSTDLLKNDVTTVATTTTTGVNNTANISMTAMSKPTPQDLLWWRNELNLDKTNLILVGFSKGCVVLNQFIYEFHYLKTLTPDDSTMMRLVSRIKDMYWLDGGHGGGKNTWITSRSLLETLCRLGINIHVHVTPYQVQDDHRPWIRKEEKAFTDLLKRLGASLTRHLHSTDSNVSNLFTHFDVLQNFRHQQIQLMQHMAAAAAVQQQQQLLIQQHQLQNNLSAAGGGVVPMLGLVDDTAKSNSASTSATPTTSNSEENGTGNGSNK